jgi:hypothetical protein
VFYQECGKLNESVNALLRAKSIADEAGLDYLKAAILASLSRVYEAQGRLEWREFSVMHYLVALGYNVAKLIAFLRLL